MSATILTGATWRDGRVRIMAGTREHDAMRLDQARQFAGALDQLLAHELAQPDADPRAIAAARKFIAELRAAIDEGARA